MQTKGKLEAGQKVLPSKYPNMSDNKIHQGNEK